MGWNKDKRRSAEEHARKYGVGENIRFEPGSRMFVGGFNKPSIGIPVNPATLDHSQKYLCSVYDMAGKGTFVPVEGQQKMPLGYKQLMAVYEALEYTKAMIVEPVTQTSTWRETRRARKRKLLLESLASEGDE